MNAILSLLTTKRVTPRAFVLVAAVASVILSGLLALNASANPVVGFQAGRIMDDSVFTNKDTMTAQQIQAFLEARVPVCDTFGTKTSEFGGGTRAQWAAARGYSPPFTCLRDFSENGKRASQIIYDVAQQFSINPQVLIVLLQKEQSLITDDWPIPGSAQYRTATGYGCPDTAPCDAEYFGLTNQLTWSGRMFRAIMNASPTWFTPYVLGNNYIQFNPNGSCGGSVVNIQNRATQALYNYTPYQPNQAALDAGWGQAACGAYGNRNFYLYFTSWFGSTLSTFTPTSNIVIPDGIYGFINSNSSRALDVVGASRLNGAGLQIWDDNRTAAQQWRVTKDTENYYTIQSVNSGRVIDVSNASTQPGARIQTWDSNGSCAQKWAAVSNGKDVLLLNKCSGLALDVSGGSSVNGSRVQAWYANYSGAQSWSVRTYSTAPIVSGLYAIQTSSGLTIEGASNLNTSATPLTIGVQGNVSTQVWHASRQTNGYYVFRNVDSGRVMTANNSSVDNGTPIQFQNPNPSSLCGQWWILNGDQSQGFTLQSACSDKVLDVQGGAISTAGTALQLWESNGTGAQRWSFTPHTGPIPNGTYSLLTSSGLAVDIRGGQTSNGTPIQVWTKNGSGAQAWRIERNPDNTYTISNVASARPLDIQGARLSNSTPIQIWGNNGTCVQRWSFIQKSDGRYEVLSACSSTWALDVSGGRIGVAGASIQLFLRNNSGAQVWSLGDPS